MNYYQPQHMHYLTVSESRRWAMDHPVGNPHHDFKKKEMPVVAIAAIAYGAAGWAAAVTTMQFVVAGAMMASGALSLAGSITGNKTLSMLGAVVGIAAGGAALFESMGNAASTGLDVADTINAGREAAEASVSAVDAANAGQAVAGMDGAAQTVSATADGGLTLNIADAAPVDDIAGSLAQNMTAAPVDDIASLGSSPTMESYLKGTDYTSMSGQGNAPLDGMQTTPTLSVDTTATGAAPQQGASNFAFAEDAAGTQAQVGSNSSMNMSVNDQVPNSGPSAKGSEYDISNGSKTIEGPPQTKGLLDQAWAGAKDAFKGANDLNKSTGGKLLDFGGQVVKAYGDKDLMKAQEQLAIAQSSGVQANVDLAKARIDEINYSLELQKKKYANANSRATNAAAQTGAVNANANIYTNPAQPAQGGLIFSGAK